MVGWWGWWDAGRRRCCAVEREGDVSTFLKLRRNDDAWLGVRFAAGLGCIRCGLGTSNRHPWPKAPIAPTPAPPELQFSHFDVAAHIHTPAMLLSPRIRHASSLPITRLAWTRRWTSTYRPSDFQLPGTAPVSPKEPIVGPLADAIAGGVKITPR